MASYFYQIDEAELGPVSFRELVKLVREEELGTDHPVRADWETDWHAAASVVGLFHMAGRDEVLAHWEAEQRRLEQERIASERAADLGVDDLDAMLRTADQVQQEYWVDPSLQRLNDPEARKRWRNEKAERDQQSRTSEIGNVVAEAVAESEAKDVQKERSRFWTAIFSRETLKVGVRWICAFSVANFVAWGIMRWTQQEQLRYPDRRSAPEYVFPLYGTCSQNEYYFLLFDAMILGGFIGYGGVKVLESIADD